MSLSAVDGEGIDSLAVMIRTFAASNPAGVPITLREGSEKKVRKIEIPPNRLEMRLRRARCQYVGELCVLTNLNGFATVEA